MENWKDIKTAPGYQVSDMGRVRSLDRYVNQPKGGQRLVTGRVLVQNRNTQGYLQVGLSVCGVAKSKPVHKLVMETFMGDRPSSDLQIMHGRDDKDDNRLANLSYGTAAENAVDKVVNGKTLKGSKHHNSLLIEEDIPFIRMRYSQGMSAVELGKVYKVSRSTILDVVARRTWAHINDNKLVSV